MKPLTPAQKDFLDKLEGDERVKECEKEIGMLLMPMLEKYTEMCTILMEHTTPELLGEDGPVVILDPLIDGLMLTFKTTILDKIDPDWHMRALKKMLIGLANAADHTPPKKHLH